MKPRTKLQHRVLELSKYLPSVENQVSQWAKIECLDHKGFATKNRVVCLDCGNTFSPDLVKRKQAICPHCNTKLKIEQTRKRTDKQHIYFAFAEIHGEFQIIRNFELISHYKTNEKPKYYCDEILQHWIIPGGKREVIGRNHTVNWYYESWNGYMELRDKSNVKKYDVYPRKIHPSSEFMPMFKKYGINNTLTSITPLEAITHIPNKPKSETLLKAKQYSLLAESIDWHGRVESRWNSIKICMRNKYIVKDAQLWFDYLDLLSYFRKDLHNAHYVCPKNLKKEHDKLVKKKRKVQAREEAEQKRIKAIEDEKIFKKLKGNFFGIAFSDKEINIKVLESISEYIEEGDILKHCVFTNNYHLKKDTLILSARIEEKPVETIELDLKKMKVIQCRGKCNNNTKYHDRILSIVNKNINIIQDRVLSTEKLKKHNRKVNTIYSL